MKILYVTTILGTVEAFLIPHIKLLQEKGNVVDIACNADNTSHRVFEDMGCRIHHVEFQRAVFKRANYAALRRMKRLVQAEGYGLIHVHTPVASFLTRFACRNIPHIKMLYTAHGFHFYKGAPMMNKVVYHALEKAASRWTHGIITMNQEDYQSAQRMIAKKGPQVYYTHGVGIDLNTFVPYDENTKRQLRKEYGFSEDAFIMIYAAELSYRKHQDLLIEAVAALAARLPNIVLLLAGEGPLLAQYKEAVEKKGLEKHILFLGFRRDVARLLEASDIAVSSSRQEGLPVNVMEAMATGLPLVVTDCRGNRDLIQSDENGYIVGIHDVEGFAKAVEQLYSSADLRRKLSAKSLASIRKYSLESVLDELNSIYFEYLQ